MKLIASGAIPLSLLVCVRAPANQAGAFGHGSFQRGVRENHDRTKPQPSNKGRAEYFTGCARIEYLFPAKAPARVSGGRVTFRLRANAARCLAILECGFYLSIGPIKPWHQQLHIGSIHRSPAPDSQPGGSVPLRVDIECGAFPIEQRHE